MEESVRINKYLSEAGVCSRREADRRIEKGYVTINGKEAVMGDKYFRRCCDVWGESHCKRG